MGLDGTTMGLVELIEAIDAIGSAHGFGRVDMIENRLVGIKTREVYEVAGALALITAHRELEDLVLTRDLLHFKQTIEAELANMIHEGQWFDPLTDACQAFLFQSQDRVSGDVRLKFSKGSCVADGRQSDFSLYSYKLATYTMEDEFTHEAAAGFIQLWGLPIETGAKLHPARSRNDPVVTDVRLHLRRAIERHDAALAALQGVLLGRAAATWRR